MWATAAERVFRAPPPTTNPAATPRERDDWYANVQQKFSKYGDKPAQIVFDGDSITNRWELTGRTVWASRYAKISANFGIEGDRTENVLWRLGKGQVDGIDPKVVVLLIGTNNVSRDSAEQVAEGIAAVVREYRQRCPRAHIVLMGIFPRGQKPDDKLRLKVKSVNSIIAKLDDGKHVSYVDISDKLTQPDGEIDSAMMADFVHPAARGYDIWADAIQPILNANL